MPCLVVEKFNDDWHVVLLPKPTRDGDKFNYAPDPPQ